MDKKDKTTTEAAGREVKGEGNIRARDRSFRSQRAATLRSSGEQKDEASNAQSEGGRDDNTGDENEQPSQSGKGRQKLMAQYRRRQRKTGLTPNESTREEQAAPTHTSTPDSTASPDDDVDTP